MAKKKKSGAAAVDDELFLQCKFWKVPFIPAPPKEKGDAAAVRQSAIREDLKKAEDAWNQSLKESEDAVKDWFFHRTEHTL